MRQLKISKSITSRESASLGKYLQEINKLKLITAEEEITLTQRIKKGDKIALEKLTKANLRFVVSVAKQFQGQGLPLTDLINEGNIGLIKAAERYDETRGFKFISFAIWWIRQNILEALAAHARLVRLPMNKVLLGNKIRRTHSELEQKLERAPSANELAEALNVEHTEIDKSIADNSMLLSLDTPLSDGEENSLLDVLEDHNAPITDRALAHTESLQMEITRTLKELPDKQRQTLCYLFGIGLDGPMSLEDVARKFELSVERVRQIKEKALLKLKSSKSTRVLKTYL